MSGQYLGFHTYLVGVYTNGTYSYLNVSGCDFPWTSSFGGAIQAHMSLTQETNGTGGTTLLQPQNLSPALIASMLQSGGNFPVTIQPSSQTAVSGANMTFAIFFATNFFVATQFISGAMNGTNISGATNLTLQLLAVTTNSTGNYDAVLSNSNGSIASAVATLMVGTLPCFNRQW